MHLPLRRVAPAGAPIKGRDLFAWSRHLLGGGDPRAQLRERLAQSLGMDRAFLTSTGRAGLTVILRAMRTVGPKDRFEVIIPSYTCFSVAASVVKAGLTPRIVDIVPDTLDYDRQALEATDTRRVLAIVATNLYGLPSDLPWLCDYARARGLFLIDDAAQAFGARVAGRWSGTWGDAGLYSFDKGKNVSAIDGGVIVAPHGRLAEGIERIVEGLPAPSATESAKAMVKVLAYAGLLHPRLYWIPSSMPGLDLGKTLYTTDYPVGRSSRALSALALVMIGRRDAFTAARVERARLIRHKLDGLATLRFVSSVAGSEPVYLRLPALASDQAEQARLIAALQRAGIGATASYPAALADVPALRNRLAGSARSTGGGRAVAARIVTLPTHPFVSTADIDRMAETVCGNVMSPRRPASSAAIPQPEGR